MLLGSDHNACGRAAKVGRCPRGVQHWTQRLDPEFEASSVIELLLRYAFDMCHCFGCQVLRQDSARFAETMKDDGSHGISDNDVHIVRLIYIFRSANVVYM
jgi:hypothetical protein